MDKIVEQYQLWLRHAAADQDLITELEEMRDRRDLMEEAFYRNLAFGTGGLRGIIGAGTNRMNIYTVAKASQGLANYIRKAVRRFSETTDVNQGNLPRIAVSYDSRIKSDLFAQRTASVLAANGLEVFLYPVIMPTPCLSFAVRHLGCAAGVMITASHNPAVYNGYKVYGADGCQITTQAAAEILEEIEKLDLFSDIKIIPFQEGIEKGQIQYISESVYTAFIRAVKDQSLLQKAPKATAAETNSSDSSLSPLSVIYTPLNGTGLRPVLKVLEESGYTHVTVVEEQREPDGNFPTCPYPNPEVREAMELGIQYAAKHQADLVLATDPDCDRVGIAVRDCGKKEYRLLSGNETGLLLLDYICSRRTADKIMPQDPVFMKTIVTTAMAEKIASHYGVKTVNVLTGFKFIGEQLGMLEAEGRENSFLFAFEESYGYLSGSYVRDKDGVVASLLICEMAAYYKTQGLSLIAKLEGLYRTYGYCLDTQHCYNFEGAQGSGRMRKVMASFRCGIHLLGSKYVVGFLDYKDGLDGLPKSDVVRFLLADDCSVVIRPSGTEPKIKVYVSVCGSSRKEAEKTEREIAESIERIIIKKTAVWP